MFQIDQCVFPVMENEIVEIESLMITISKLLTEENRKIWKVTPEINKMDFIRYLKKEKKVLE